MKESNLSSHVAQTILAAHLALRTPTSCSLNFSLPIKVTPEWARPSDLCFWLDSPASQSFHCFFTIINITFLPLLLHPLLQLLGTKSCCAKIYKFLFILMHSVIVLPADTLPPPSLPLKLLCQLFFVAALLLLQPMSPLPVCASWSRNLITFY